MSRTTEYAQLGGYNLKKFGTVESQVNRLNCKMSNLKQVAGKPAASVPSGCGLDQPQSLCPGGNCHFMAQQQPLYPQVNHGYNALTFQSNGQPYYQVSQGPYNQPCSVNNGRPCGGFIPAHIIPGPRPRPRPRPRPIPRENYHSNGGSPPKKQSEPANMSAAASFDACVLAQNNNNTSFTNAKFEQSIKTCAKKLNLSVQEVDSMLQSKQKNNNLRCPGYGCHDCEYSWWSCSSVGNDCSDEDCHVCFGLTALTCECGEGQCPL